MTSINPDRVWNTWDHRYPGCFVHVPSGFGVKLSAYSGKDNRYEDFRVNGPSSTRYGAHESDGGYAELTLGHAGTLVRVEFAKPTWSGVVARVRVVKPAELYFRFVLVLEAGFVIDEDRPQDARTVAFVESNDDYSSPTAAMARWRSESFCVEVSPRPVEANAYDDLDDLRRHFEDCGWLYRAPFRASGRWAMFRYSGDPKVDVYFAAACETDDQAARAAAHQILVDGPATLDRAARSASTGDDPTRAIRDVMAWNTVWDTANHRPYTCLTRGWVDHLGGWGIWLTDVLYNALLNARVGDWPMARANLAAVLNNQQPSGVLPCLMAGFEEWVDRSQLSIASYITWRIYLLTGDRVMLAESYGVLRRYHDWWFSTRDGNGNGLFEYGSSPTGHAHNAHTKQGAMNESGMDNMPIFDDAVFNEQSHTLEFEEVGLNSLLALDTEMLALIAYELGLETDSEALDRQAASLVDRIQTELWDPSREIFAGRFWSGSFARQLSPTSFFPLVAGAATADQADALVSRHLLNEQEFWGPLPLPSTPFNDPISGENSYWRGRIWPPLNFFTWEGLRRYGRDDVASALASRSWEMFSAEWEQHRHCHENFHIRDPHLHESPDSDPFYSWGALIPLMALLESADVSPWDGLSLRGTPSTSAQISLPGRRFAAVVQDDVLRVTINGTDALEVSPPVRIRDLRVDEACISLRLPATTESASGYEIRVLGLGVEDVLHATAGEDTLTPVALPAGVGFEIGPSEIPVDIRVALRDRKSAAGASRRPLGRR